MAFLNAWSSIDVTLFGMIIDSSEVAMWKAKDPICVSTLSASKVTETSEPAERNASAPIDVTLFGISASPAQLELPVTTLSVIVKEPLVLQFTVAAHAGGATRVAPSRANTAVSDSFFAFNIIAPFL